MTGPGLSGRLAVVDTSGVINAFLQEARGMTLPSFDPAGGDVDLIIIGPHDMGKDWYSKYRAAMDRVAGGATLVVLDNADRWAQQMDSIYSFQALQYQRFSPGATEADTLSVTAIISKVCRNLRV